jgi:outer membrane protein OmpA-like peptidoglycan-associated protein
MNIPISKLICAAILINIGLLNSSSLFAQEINLLEFAKNSDVFNVELKPALGINTNALEFSPAYFGDGIVYIYANPRKATKKDKEINSAPFGLYYAPFNDMGMPEKSTVFSKNISSDFHLGPAAFNQAQDVLFFSRNDIPLNLKTKSRKEAEPYKSVQKLYQAVKGPDDWIQIETLPFNSDTFSIFHPALSPDGKRLYFTSDMPGGYGETDIYYVEKIGSGWSPPINAGPVVNTPGKEAYPFVHQNGDLYFASNSHPGMGGFDIFVSRQNGRNWTQPANLGAPINSKSDDFGICIAANSYEGFFTSNRSGGKGKDDIYKFRLKLREDLPYVQAQVLCIDKNERKRISDAEIRVIELSPSGSPDITAPIYAYKETEDEEIKYQLKGSAKLKPADFMSDSDGAAVVQLFKHKKYVIMASKEGYHSAFMPVAGTQTELRINLEKIPVKSCVWLNGTLLDKESMNPVKGASVATLDRISGEGKALKTGEDGSFSACLYKGQDYEIHISHDNYIVKREYINFAEDFNETEIEKAYHLERISVFKEKGTLEEGKTIILNNIYYDYNEFSIRTDATKELDELAELMKTYISMEIELIAHTDSRGDWMYNQKLSLQRANAAKEYLVNLGVSEKRIRSLGYGESQIRNHCFDGVPCSDEDHQYNRRTEVRIVSLKEKIQFDRNE